MRRADKNLLTHVLRHRLFLLLSLILFLFLAFSFGREYVRNKQISKSIAQLESQAQMLEERNVEIAQINAQLESEQFLEKEARLRLGLVKSGERVVVVSGEDSQTVDIGGEAIMNEIDEELPAGTVGRWRAYFFDTDTFDRLKLVERPRL